MSKRLSRISLLACCLLLPLSMAYGDSSDVLKSVLASLETVQTQLSTVRTELQAARSEQASILTQLAAAQKAQADITSELTTLRDVQLPALKTQLLDYANTSTRELRSVRVQMYTICGVTLVASLLVAFLR